MKSTYKVILITILYLCVSVTYAQDKILKGADSDTPILIDPIGGGDEDPIERPLPEVQCFCFFFSDFGGFQNYLSQPDPELELLRKQEYAMKYELEERFNTRFPTFRLAQQRLFIQLAKNFDVNGQYGYFSRVSEWIADNKTYSSNKIADTESSLKTVQEWLRERDRIQNGQSRQYYFGDLKYNNTKIESMNGWQTLSAISSEQDKFNSELNKKKDFVTWQRKLTKAKENQAFEFWLSNRYLDFYDSLSYRDKIAVMTAYMATQYNGSVLSPPAGYYINNIYYSFNQNYLPNMVSITGNQSVSTPSVSGANLSADDAIFRYAANSMGTNISRFLFKSDHSTLKIVTNRYLKNYRYNSNSLNNIGSAIDGYLNNILKSDFLPRHFLSGTPDNLPVNIAYQFNYTLQGEDDGFRGLSSFYNELYNLDGDHYHLEGYRIRWALIYGGSSIDFSNVSNEELGRMFNFSHMFPFGGNYEFFLDYAFIPPSCKSFNFTQIAGFHEASVVNIRFNVVVIEIVAGVRVKKVIPIIFPQPVRFGVPRTFSNGTLISSGLAAELSARAIEESIDDVISRYNNLVVNSTDVIRSYFKDRLRHNHREITNGGRVNFNDMSNIGLVPTQYKTSAWLRDNCD